MKKLPISLFCLLALGACNAKQSAHENADTIKIAHANKGALDIETIKKQIALQNGMENNDVPENQVHFLDQKDIELSLAVIKEGLAEAGYKTPDKADFESKIEALYHCNNKNNADWKGTSLGTYMTPDSWLAVSKFIDYYSDHYGDAEMDSYRMVAFGKYNFLFDLDFLKNLITIKPDGQYKITLPRNIIARNRYFFNGNKADLDYLVKNDKDFLGVLVEVFGYDEVPEMNGAALSTYNTGTKNNEDIGMAVFHHFTKPGELVVRKRLLQYIYEHTTANNNNMAKGLSNFAFQYHDLDRFKEVDFGNICKIVAYSGTLEEQLREKYMGRGTAIWNPYSLLTNFKLQYPNFIDEIKKENYYDDSEIKKAIAAAENAAQAALIKPDTDN